MKAKLLFTICLLLLGNSIIKGQEKKNFEGELHIRNVSNLDKNLENMSQGSLGNGEQNTIYLIKGNKVLSYDEGMQTYRLHDDDKNVVVTYSTLIKKGYKMMASGVSASKEGLSVDGKTVIKNSLHRFEKKEDAQFLGMRVEHLTGRIETSYGVESASGAQDVDIYVIPSISVPNIANIGATLLGIGNTGLVCKFRTTNTTTFTSEFKGMPKWVNKKVNKKLSKMVGNEIDLSNNINMKYYSYFEVKEIKERKVDDSEFAIPGDVQIHDLGVYDTKKKLKELQAVDDFMMNFQKEQSEYLMKHNIHPRQVKLDVVYEIDQDWDF